MSTEPNGMQPTPPADADLRRRRAPWAAVSVTAGAAFAIIAVLHVGGIGYVVVAILAGLAYTLLGIYNRREG